MLGIYLAETIKTAATDALAGIADAKDKHQGIVMLEEHHRRVVENHHSSPLWGIRGVDETEEEYHFRMRRKW